MTVNTRFFDSLAEADRKLLILEAAGQADAAHAEWLRKVTAGVHKAWWPRA
ncbi:MAG: hypothetical protein R3E48_09215 [Burkholderiaceae bacterium]